MMNMSIVQFKEVELNVELSEIHVDRKGYFAHIESYLPGMPDVL